MCSRIFLIIQILQYWELTGLLYIEKYIDILDT